MHTEKQVIINKKIEIFDNKKLETSEQKKAYNFAKAAHEGQFRSSGEPYFNHVLETAKTIAEWKLDNNTIIAAFLHDIVENTEITIEEIKKEFGPEVAFLVAGVTKLKKIHYRGEESEVQNIRKMILAMAEDITVVLIKLADRLHNMKTLSALAPEKQKRIALETREIYAPLAYRLGMQNISGQLEDLAFLYLSPKEYDWLQNTVTESYDNRHLYLESIKPIIVRELNKNKIIEDFSIDFRAKRYNSLYKKLQRNDMNIENIYDQVALRIIVPTIDDCYKVLGIIHSLWTPLPRKIKDYIATPKPNGYRSLHTTVFCVDSKITEFQIKTKEMHHENEFGIAAHWAYKEKDHKFWSQGHKFTKHRKELIWVKQLSQWQKNFTEPKDFIESMKIDFFKDRIFVFTPTGEVIDLPVGATPIDFAYKIHTKIGDSCSSAEVNNKIVPFDWELRSGDVVKILTQKNKTPSRSWLDYVKTASARIRVKKSLDQQKSSTLCLASRKKIEFRATVEDRLGILKDVAAVFANSKVNIEKVSQLTSSMPVFKLKCGALDTSKIEKLLVKIKKISGVKEVSYRYCN